MAERFEMRRQLSLEPITPVIGADDDPHFPFPADVRTAPLVSAGAVHASTAGGLRVPCRAWSQIHVWIIEHFALDWYIRSAHGMPRLDEKPISGG